MVEFEINKGVSKTELAIKLAGVTQLDVFRYRMLQENTIPGVLSCVRSQENELTVYTYDITGMRSVESNFESKKLGLSEIKQLYIDIITTLLKSEEYFLDKDCFLLSQKFIYYDEASRSYQLLYCPEEANEMKVQLADLTEYVINHTEYSDQAAVALVYEVFKMMREEHTTILEILTYITEGKKQNQLNAKTVEQRKIESKEPIYEAQPYAVKVQKPVENKPLGQVVVKNPFEEKNEEPDTDTGFSARKLLLCTAIVAGGIGIFLALYFSGVLFIAHTKKLDTSKFAGVALLVSAVAGYGCYKVFGMKEEEKKVAKEKKEKDTTVKEVVTVQQPMPFVQPVMQAQPVPSPMPEESKKQRIEEPPKKKFYRLVAEKEKRAQQFVLYKSPYILGKSYEQVDGVVYSDAVSKVHAEFIEEQGMLYVIDMSSTNGTYVNRRKIASNERVAVGSGDRIQIADKEYLLCS